MAVSSPSAVVAAAPSASRLGRRALLVGLAAGPAAWLLLPGLLATTAIPGAPSGGVYPLLHRWWAVGGAAPARFPEPGLLPAVDPAAWLLHPLVVALGAALVVKGVMLAGMIATLLVTWRYARRITGDDWAASATTAVFTASPAVVAGVTGGDLDAWHGWALLVIPLFAGPATLAAGLAVAVLAPTMVPAALLPAALATWTAARHEGRPAWTRAWPLAGWGLAVLVASLVGWPTVPSTAGYSGWFSALTPALEPERVHQVYVGFGAAGLLAMSLVPVLGGARARPWGIVGLLALVLSLVSSPVPPERFLHLVPFAAALGCLAILRARAPAWAPAGAVWVATLLVGEGWKGVAAPVPLLTATLVDPAPVAELAEGPVLDLPATHTAIRRGLWFQTHHGRPIAADVEGHLTPEIATLGATLMTGGCGDVAAQGFRTVVARREGSLRELAPLRACLGEPAWDDGQVAVWRLDPPAAPTP